MKLKSISQHGLDGRCSTFNYKGKRSKQAFYCAWYGASKKKIARFIGSRRANVLLKTMGIRKNSTIKSTKVDI